MMSEMKLKNKESYKQRDVNHEQTTTRILGRAQRVFGLASLLCCYFYSVLSTLRLHSWFIT